VKKLIIIAALLAMITAVYAQIQPESIFDLGKTVSFTGISTDNIVITGHKQIIHKKHSHKNNAKSKILSSFAAEEENKDELVNCPLIHGSIFIAESGSEYFRLGNNNVDVYKVKANLTTLKTRK
jgi:hypothetical protein